MKSLVGLLFLFSAQSFATDQVLYDCSGRYIPYSSQMSININFELASTENENRFSPQTGSKRVYTSESLKITASNKNGSLALEAEVAIQDEKEVFVRSFTRSNSSERLTLEYSQVGGEGQPVGDATLRDIEVLLSLVCVRRN